MAKNRRTTIADIAARAGVSISAVSFALNDRPGVSDETRARVQAIARELDWQPHTAARALGGAKAGSIGFVLNRPARTLGTESFFGDLISGIQLGLAGSHVGMNLLVARDAEGAPRLLGPTNPLERACWGALTGLGRASAGEVAGRAGR